MAFLAGSVMAQVPMREAFGEPVQSLELKQRGVEKIEADTEGNLFLLAPSQHRLHKLFRITQYDSVLTVGGKGIEKEAFNYPTKIEVPNRQGVYILDYYNRRLIILNVNLKVVREVNFLTLQDRIAGEQVDGFMPFTFTVGPTGELYLFNQDNYKIYKYTVDGRILRSFAGMDYGAGSVVEPCEIRSNESTNIFVPDCEQQSILVYDMYGVFLYELPVPVPFVWTDVKVFGETIIYSNEDNIYFYNYFTKKTGPHLQPTGKLRDIALNGDFMFVLTEKRVNLYRLKRAGK